MKNSFKIFIVEDDRMYQKMLTHILKKEEDLEIHLFNNGEDCLAALSLKPDIISMDYTLPDVEGMYLLNTIMKRCPNAEVIVLSGQGEINTVSQVLDAGAYDFIAKDVTTKYRLRNAIKHLKETIRLRQLLNAHSSAY